MPARDSTTRACGFSIASPRATTTAASTSPTTSWVGGRVFAYWQAPVRQFLIDNARQCFEEYHVDGIRYDEVTVIAANGGGSFCQDLSSTIRFERPETIQIAEYWGGERDVAVRPAPFGFGFDAAWSDRLRDAVRRAISAASGGRDAFVDIEDLARAYDPPADFGAAWRASQLPRGP